MVRYLNQGRADTTTEAPSPRRPTGWIMARPKDLTQRQQADLAEALGLCPHLQALAGHVRAFADILTHRRGDVIRDWITAVEDEDLPALHSCTTGLRADLDAVIAGLLLPYSNGPIEGANTKVKYLKRQMYGRAGFALLRQRILLT